MPIESSLSSVLAHLGHDCEERCGFAADELGAQVWFTRRGAVPVGRRNTVLVVIDTMGYVGSLVDALRLLRQINQCASADGIYVSRRRLGDARHALAAVNLSCRGATVVHSAPWARGANPHPVSS